MEFKIFQQKCLDFYPIIAGNTVEQLDIPYRSDENLPKQSFDSNLFSKI